MAFTSTIILIIAMTSTVQCYPGGAPVSGHPEICSGSMMPSHGYSAQTSTAPYKIVVPSCYKAGSPVKVSVEATSGYYEGLFMMARLPGDSTAAYGTFTVDNAEWFKMLACYTQTGSSITHSKKKHFTSEVFRWTAPSHFQKTITFQATIVKETDEFWVNVFSSEISYSATCASEETTTTTNTTNTTTVSTTTLSTTTSPQTTPKPTAGGSGADGLRMRVSILISATAILFGFLRFQ